MCRRMMYVVVVTMLGLIQMNLVYGFDPGNPDLLAWWACDEGEGTVVADASGNGRDGVFVNGDPSWGPGVRGSAIELVGPTLVEVPPLDMVLTEATMAGWIKPNGPQPDWSSFIMQRDPGLATGFNILGYQLAYHWNDTSDSWNFRGGDMIAEDEWTFAAVTIEPDRATFYVNGVAGSVNEITHGPCDWNSNIYLGGDGTAGWVSRRMNGALDDVSMFSRALTAEEIVTIMGGIEPAPSPFISISTLDDWGSLLNRPAGAYPRIDPVPRDVFEEMVQSDPDWPPEYQGADFATPELDAREYEDESGQVGPALYMRWGPEGADVQPGVYNAASWDYDYGVATDFSNVELEFSILAPQIDTRFAVNILDENGNFREFIWRVGGLGEILPRQWTTVQLDPTNGNSNYPLEVDPFEGGGDFQLNRIRIIRFNENVVWNGDFPLDDGRVWNVWADIEVRPAPSPFISISTLDDWSNLLNLPEGVYPRIDPVDANEFQSMVIGNPGWPTQYRGAAFATPALDARDFDDEFGQVGPRLYMSWGPEGAEVVPGVYNAAAWDYDYGVATDFSNVELEFFFLAPVISTLFSVNILDENGDWLEFIWHVSETTEIPAREWTTIQLNPSNEISNFPFEVDPFEGGRDFQLNRVRRIRFNENVAWNGDFPLDNGWVWNDWANLEVRPDEGPVNLLENGGFEDGVMEPWNTYGNVTTEVVQTDPAEGAYCLNLVVPDAGANFWDAGLQHTGHVFETGKNYKLSAWLKSSQGPLDINFKPELGVDPWTGYGSQAFTMTEEWAEYSVETGVFDADVSPATITFHIAYTPGDFFVDDVKFVEIEQ